MIKALKAILALALMVAGPVFAGPEVSSPSNHVVSGGQGVEKSVDSSERTKWCGLHEGRPVQWMLKLSEDGGMAVKSYSIISGNDEPTRDPKDWILEGSQDGEYWTELDRQRSDRCGSLDVEPRPAPERREKYPSTKAWSDPRTYRSRKMSRGSP